MNKLLQRTLLQRYVTITTTPNSTVVNSYNYFNIIVPINRRKTVTIETLIATLSRIVTLPITVEL